MTEDHGWRGCPAPAGHCQAGPSRSWSPESEGGPAPGGGLGPLDKGVLCQDLPGL